MSQADKRLATDATLQATNTALGLLGKDATLGQIKTALGLLAKDGTLDDIKDAIALLASNTTLQATNTALGLLGKDASLQAIANILASVKSVNGKYGVVVLDSGDILISKNTQNSKTTKQVLTELQNAIDATPLTFTASEISGKPGQYALIVETGTPS